MAIFPYFIQGKMAQNGSYNGYKMTKNASNQLKFSVFWPKNAPLVPLEPHKTAKTQNIKNPLHSSVEGIIQNKYTDFQPILSIFEGPDTFSVEKKGTISRRGTRAKWPFFGQKTANFKNFSKIFQNLIKLIEIQVWSKFQLI